MQNVQHAIDVIAKKLGFDKLEFDENDQLGLDANMTTSIHITRVSDVVVEISTPLTDLDLPDPAVMRAMLEANFLGAGVDAARLALDADKEEVILCERWYVNFMDANAVEARFEAFVLAALFWQREGVESLRDRAISLREEMQDAPSDLDDEGGPTVIMRL